MPPTNPLGIILALTSAAFFGSSDFCGGMAARRNTQNQVLALSSIVSLAVLILLAVLWGEGWPSLDSALWGGLAGLAGGLGLASLYRGLSTGRAAVVSPVSGVISALLPVIFAGFTVGLPSATQLAGFLIAVPGIWLVSLVQPVDGENHKSGLGLGIVAGIAFGLFFICLARINGRGVFGPLVIEKAASILLGTALLLFSRQSFPSWRSNPMILVAGALDPLANALYLVSTTLTRLDVAAVLSSLYPAGTVFLSRIVLKEHIAPRQWVGVALCLLAIVLITL